MTPALLGALLGHAAWAATGCSLRDPGADIRRFFPEATHYVVNYVTFARQDPGGQAALARALGDPVDPVYETPDVPYTLYTVRRAGAVEGYVFGTNQRGRYGAMQVIAVTDADLDLQHVYVQTIRSPAFEAFQGPAFDAALSAVPLDRYPAFSACFTHGDCAGVPVADPTDGDQAADYRAVLRAVARLSGLRARLLRPGEVRRPPSLAALGEWVGNHEALELSRAVATAPRFDPGAELDPAAPVVVVRHGGRVAAFPVDRLRATPLVRWGPVQVSWSETSGTAAALVDAPPLVPTADLLFGLRVLRDEHTASTWAPVPGLAVLGPRAGAPLERAPSLVLPWGVARAAQPGIPVLAGEAAPPPRAPPTEPLALVVGGTVLPLAALPPLAQVEVEGRRVLVQQEGGRAWAIDAHNGAGVLTFEAAGAGLRDRETGSTWTRLGRCTGGPLTGLVLNWPVQALLPTRAAASLVPPPP